MVVTKKIILIALLIVVLFHVVWYAASRSFQNEKLPDDATVQAAFNKFLKDEKISIDPHAFTETSVEANGIKLHLDVFSKGKSQPTIVFKIGRASCREKC